jgi:FkbM family methyltransferase
MKQARVRGVSKLENVRHRIATYKTWYKIVFPFNRWFKGIQHMRLRNGKSIYVRSVRSMDVNIASDVLGDNEYELEQLRLPDNATVVDLGGNIGTFAMEIHRMFPSARIISYEPHPGNCYMFRINAPFATLMQKAASGETGTVHLEDNDNYVGLRLTEKGGIEVRAQSLDDILKDIETVDLLKIDIEGSEFDVLDNTSPATFDKVQTILMEVHNFTPGFDHAAWAENILSKNGFKVSWIIPISVIYGEKSE